MEGILAAFADSIVSVPESVWTKLTHPVQMTVNGQSIPVQVIRQDAIECIKRSLGPDATAEVRDNGLVVAFAEGAPGNPNPPSTNIILPGFFKTGIAVPNDLTTVNTGPLTIRKTGPYLKVMGAIQTICSGRPTKSDIQKQVAAREGRKAYRAMLGWQGPAESSASSSSSSAAPESAQRRKLPEDVARHIAKYAAVKKIEGGRKKTRKTKKTKKATRRH